MKRSRITITDHAVLRYVERVLGIDIDAVRSDIAATISVAEEHPTATAVKSNGFRYVLINDALVTITRAERSSNRTSPKCPKVQLP